MMIMQMMMKNCGKGTKNPNGKHVCSRYIYVQICMGGISFSTIRNGDDKICKQYMENWNGKPASKKTDVNDPYLMVVNEIKA
jgi:hypothetical protein